MSEPVLVEPAQPWAAPAVDAVDSSAPQFVSVQPSGPSFLVRAVWFVLVGWWLTAIVVSIAYVLALTVIGLPFAFYIFNRIPAVLTLRGRTKTYQVATSADGTRTLTSANIAQLPLLLRAIWFVLVGFWLGAIWMSVAYVLCLLIVTIPFGLAMFNRVGAVMTLLRY